jgi:hypothetical protein
MKIVALNPLFLPRYQRKSRSPAVAMSGGLYYPRWLVSAVEFVEKWEHKILVTHPGEVMHPFKAFMALFINFLHPSLKGKRTGSC